MSFFSRPLQLGHAERYVFRPVFVFFTFTLMLFAIAQASGRFAMYTLEFFDAEINALLVSQQAAIFGLQGDWHGLNPIVRAQSIEFPAGRIGDVEVELDVLESIWRNTLVLRRLSAADVRLDLERTSQGWRLRGMKGEGNQFDVVDLLRHSDELLAGISLYFHDGKSAAELAASAAAAEQGVQALRVQAWVANRNKAHFAHVEVTNPVYPADNMQVSLWQRNKVWLVQDPLNAVQMAGSLHIPERLASMPQLNLEVENLFWRDENDIGGGLAQLRLAGIDIPTADTFSANVTLQAVRSDVHWRGVVRSLDLGAGEDRFELGPLYVQGAEPEQLLNEEEPSTLELATGLLTDGPTIPLVSVWLEQLDFASLSEFLQAHLDLGEPAGRWIKSLALTGRANNIHLFYDPPSGLGYQATLANLSMQGYRGAPTARNISAKVWGYERGIAVQASGRDAYLGFPDLYSQGWTLDTVQGVVKAWFHDGYFGMRGSHLRASFGDTNIGGGFAITRPMQRHEQRLSLTIEADQVGLIQAKTFVPSKIPQALADWIDQGPRAGLMRNAQFAYHGQVHVRPGELARRIELRSEIRDARVEYAPLWPEVADIVGSVHVAGVDTRIQVDGGRSQGVRINRAHIVLHDNTTYAAGDIDTQADANSMLEFVRSSPLRENLGFVSPGWQGSGLVRLRGELSIPINAETAPPLAVNLDFDVDNMSLAMPDYRLVTRQMSGRGKFSLPHHLTGDFSGQIFDQAASVHAHFNDDWLLFDIKGTARPDDVYTLLESRDRVPIEGQFNFDSVLSIAMRGGVTNLFVASDLVGLSADLPGDFAKAADVAAESDLNVQFLQDYSSVSYRYKNVIGWLHYGEGIERGALGIGTSPPMTAQDQRAIVISGHLPKLVLSDWVGRGGDSAVSLPLDWTIQGLRVDQFVIDKMSFADLLLTGAQEGDEVLFDFQGPTVRGSVALPSNDMMLVNLDYLQVPGSTEAEEQTPVETEALTAPVSEPSLDPIGVEVGQNLPAARIAIAQLDIGDAPFGAWRFVINPADDEVVFREFNADVNGVHIKDSEVVWDLQADHSSFVGKIGLDDLAETLPKWDYAASLSTQEANVALDVTWQGSPLNINLLGTNGSLNFHARDGRFIEVESGSGGLRILSLINFTKLAKRINFDFSDVVGEGLSFEKINATVNLKEGNLTFPQRMTVESSAGNFQVGGRVDLRSGTLDNEMIVTLPVSKSLPWYGVYLALANPLVGLGVVVGERVLRKPMEQFSTAKFEVTGTLNDPKVKFVSLWDQSMKDPELQDPELQDPALAGDPVDRKIEDQN